MNGRRFSTALAMSLLAAVVATAVCVTEVSAATSSAPIAFGKDGDIWTVAADGSGPRQLTSGGADDYGPAWSSDHGTIAFIRRPGRRVWLVNAAGGSVRRLTYTGPSLVTGSTDLAYSPNGRLLAGSQVLSNGRYAITVLNLRTKTSRLIVRYFCEGGARSLTWSPNSRQLIATIEYGGGYGTLRIDVPGKRLIRTNYGGNMESASWRADGRYLLCSYWKVEEPHYPFWTFLMKPNGTKVKKLGEAQRFPDYSPDGSQYAFLRFNPNNDCDLLVANADGSGVTTIVEGVYFGGPAWK